MNGFYTENRIILVAYIFLLFLETQLKQDLLYTLPVNEDLFHSQLSSPKYSSAQVKKTDDSLTRKS